MATWTQLCNHLWNPSCHWHIAGMLMQNTFFTPHQEDLPSRFHEEGRIKHLRLIGGITPAGSGNCRSLHAPALLRVPFKFICNYGNLKDAWFWHCVLDLESRANICAKCLKIDIPVDHQKDNKKVSRTGRPQRRVTRCQEVDPGSFILIFEKTWQSAAFAIRPQGPHFNKHFGGALSM